MHFKDLTKKEKKHLREMGITTLREFVRNAELQKEMRDQPPPEGFTFYEPCWDCRMIAKKLELPVKEGNRRQAS